MINDTLPFNTKEINSLWKCWEKLAKNTAKLCVCKMNHDGIKIKISSNKWKLKKSPFCSVLFCVNLSIIFYSWFNSMCMFNLYICCIVVVCAVAISPTIYYTYHVFSFLTVFFYFRRRFLLFFFFFSLLNKQHSE